VSGHRLLVAGRISGDPFPIPGGGELYTLVVPDGARSRNWAAFRGPGHHLACSLADGDAVAIVGTIDPNRKGSGNLQGPVTIDAILGLGANGDILGGFKP
jgi:hypothetical protein